MSHITNIISKELKELLTPGSVISVVLMVVLFAGLGGMIDSEIEKAQAFPELCVVNEDASIIEFTDADGTYTWSISSFLEDLYTSSGIPEDELSDYIRLMDSDSIDEAYAIMEEEGISSALFVDPDFSKDIVSGTRGVVEQIYVYEPTGMFGTVSSSVVSSVMSMINEDLSKRLLGTQIDMADYGFLTEPIDYNGDNVKTIVNGKVVSGITPQEIAGEVSSQTMMIPIIIMIIIMMVGSLVISSMGSEKENKTLETLLTLPIKRTSIVAGKIIAAAIVGLVYGLAYMVGMSIYMNSLTGTMSSGLNLEDLGLTLSVGDYALVMLSMFLSIICALGICMILGAFAKNYKSAQTMTMPLSIMAMIPMFIVMFSGWYGSGALIQAVTFAIPFSHPMMAMQALMYDDVTLVLSGIVYMVVFAVATILITVKLYNSDILITGLGQNKTVQKLTGRK